jgi:two-component system chemotaxis response regulator CheB
VAEHRDVIVVGASAGGVEALRALAAGLPPEFPGVVLVVLHIPRDSPSALSAILTRSGPLPASMARDGEKLEPGRIYVAANDHHLLVLDGHVRLSRGPAENGHRPAIDPLFRSAARAWGRRVIGVVLSGTRDDGASGLESIVDRGGVGVVQDPDDALHAAMPRAAMGVAEHVVAASKMGSLIAGLVAAELPDAAQSRADPLLDAEVAMSELSPLTTEDLDLPAAGYGCPSCGGALFQVTDKPVPRFRCRIGHAWSPESLLDEQAVALEGALWMALRALEEKSALSRRMAGVHRNESASGRRFRELADDAEAAGEAIRRLIDQIGSTGGEAAGRPALR